MTFPTFLTELCWHYLQPPWEEIVEMEYSEMLFWVETKRSDKELYRIIGQSRPVQMMSY